MKDLLFIIIVFFGLFVIIALELYFTVKGA